MDHLSIDYETRSECDLRLCGAYAYAEHPSTQVLCAAFRIDDGEIEYWRAWKGEKIPPRLKQALAQCKELHAWNSQFERLVTEHVVGIKGIALSRWHCTAAWARARALPGKLEGALEFIGYTEGVDRKREGNRIMLKWCRPLPGGGWADDEAEYWRLVAYCGHDVVAEIKLQEFLACEPMRKDERADFLLTERMNDTGLPVDVPFAEAAKAYGAQEADELRGQIEMYSGGEITSQSQHARMKTYLKQHLPPEVYERFFTRYRNDERKETTDGAAREAFLASEDAKECDSDLRSLLESMDDANKSSVSKYDRITKRANGKHRVQGAYLYAGAAQTKRFSSTGVQMHNLPRVTPKNLLEVVEQVRAHALPQGTRVMHVLASCLRPTIKAPEGRVLVWGDWSAIEAKCMPWLAAQANIEGAREKLQLYVDGIDVYKVNARDIDGTPYAKVSDEQRQTGKVAELSLLFGGWAKALMAMARGYRIALTEGQAEAIASAWRRANPWAADYQHTLYRAYARAALFKETHSVGDITYYPVDALRFNKDGNEAGTVACRLPDGTVLLYPGGQKARVIESRRRPSETGLVWRRQPVSVSRARRLWNDTTGRFDFKTETQYYKAAFNQLVDETVWHGLLAENCTQGVCAALLRDCLRRLEKRLKDENVDALIVGHTHDEILLEAGMKAKAKAARILETEMLRVPDWAEGLPLAAQIKTGLRYVK